VELGTEIFHSDCGSYYKGQAISQIALTYAASGNLEMAEKWACKAFQLIHSQEILFMQITNDGEEMISEFSFANYWYLQELFYMGARIAKCDNIPGGTTYVYAVSKAIASIYELVFPNDDMGFEDLKHMCVQHRSIAEDEISLGNDEEIIKGNVSENKMNIFELCKDLERFEIPKISSDMNCWKFIEFISGCNSIEEISLKMQLMGL
jgi:hypothetical protein